MRIKYKPIARIIIFIAFIFSQAALAVENQTLAEAAIFQINEVGKEISLKDGHKVKFDKLEEKKSFDTEEGNRIYLLFEPRCKKVDLRVYNQKGTELKPSAIGQNTCCEEKSNHNYFFHELPTQFTVNCKS